MQLPGSRVNWQLIRLMMSFKYELVKLYDPSKEWGHNMNLTEQDASSLDKLRVGGEEAGHINSFDRYSATSC